MSARRAFVLRRYGPGQQLKVELVAGAGETLVEMQYASVTQAAVGDLRKMRRRPATVTSQMRMQ